MSFDFAYVRRSFDAALRLALRDEKAIGAFDMTVDGFFKSFAALLLALPLFVLLNYGWAHVIAAIAASDPGALRDASAEFSPLDFSIFAAIFLGPWVIFPFVALAILKFLRQTSRFTALVIAFNWGRIVILLIQLPPVVLFGAGMISAQDSVLLEMMMVGLTLYYRYFMAQSALQTGWATAMAVALVDLMLHWYWFLAVVAVGEGLSV